MNAHGSNVLDSEALLDELDDHLELSALASVAGVRDGDGLSRGILVEGVGSVVLVQRSHGESTKRKERKREGAQGGEQDLKWGGEGKRRETRNVSGRRKPETATCRQAPLHRSPPAMTAALTLCSQ